MKEKVKFSLLIAVCIVVGLAFSVFSIAYFLLLHHYSGKNVDYIWQETDEFCIENIKTVEKNADEDFVILNLADVQMCDLEDILHFNTIKAEIDFLIKTTKPNLITLSGDQTWSNENLICLMLLVNLLESYKIPWAPVFGNHDYGNEGCTAVAGKNVCCDIYERAPHCLFSRGPTNLNSLGNYVFNITENGKILKTVFMLDSGYEQKISNEQIAWLKWNANGIKIANGGVAPEGMCFLHKPLPEFRTAYVHYLYDYGDVTQISEDVQVFYSLNGSEQNGAFDALKTCNVKDIVCGHQHGNNFTLSYQDVRLTFALKTGELGGFVQNEDVYLNGATFFTISNLQTSVANLRVNPNQFKIK